MKVGIILLYYRVIWNNIDTVHLRIRCISPNTCESKVWVCKVKAHWQSCTLKVMDFYIRHTNWSCNRVAKTQVTKQVSAEYKRGVGQLGLSLFCWSLNSAVTAPVCIEYMTHTYPGPKYVFQWCMIIYSSCYR